MLRLLLTLDFNTLTKDEQEETVQTLLINLMTDDYVQEKVDAMIDTACINTMESVLGGLESIFSVPDYSETSGLKEVVSRVKALKSNSSSLNRLANSLRTEGDVGLQQTLIKELAVSTLTTAGMEFVKETIYTAATYDVMIPSMMEAAGDASSIVSGVLDIAIFKPLKSINNAQRAEFVNGIMNLLFTSREANLILDTIITTFDGDNNILEEIQDILFDVYMYQWPGIQLLNAVHTDFEEIIVGVAKDLKNQMTSNLGIAVEMLIDLGVSYGEDIGKFALKTTISQMLGKANVYYMIFGLAFSALDSAFGWSDYYKATDTFNLASCVTLALSLGFNQRLGAFNDVEKIDELNNCLNTNYSADNLDDLALDTMTLLKAICNSRLLGEYTFKSIVKENNATIFKGDYKYDAQMIEKCNAKFGTDYNNIEDVYDYIYGNILEARDAIFNVEYTSDIVKPEAPVVTFNYSTLATNQEFDGTYEYCLSDGEWKTCDGKISVELKTTTQVLRVRKAAGNGNVAGHITTVTIYAQKELSKIITVKYDNGIYCICR